MSQCNTDRATAMLIHCAKLNNEVHIWLPSSNPDTDKIVLPGNSLFDRFLLLVPQGLVDNFIKGKLTEILISQKDYDDIKENW